MPNNFSSHFLLDPTVTFLNIGSFGACPKPIFEEYQNWQMKLEQEPVQFIKFNAPAYLEIARKVLGTYLHADADDIVYVPNPTTAANIIAKSFPLQAGDEVLTTDLEYGACAKTWSYYCKKAAAKLVQQPITLPIVSKNQFIADFFAGCTAKTKLIFISHITSTTALIFPVQEIVALAKQKGIPIFVDGAHAPGQVPLDLQDLDADFYTGACHKWMMTPKGSSFLHVKKKWQTILDPLVVSWGYDSAIPSHSQFLDYHQMQGTRDFSAYLCISKAIEYMQQNNWQAVTASCRELVLYNANRFITLFNSTPISPITNEWIAQMLSIPIHTNNAWELEKHLFEKYRITIPIMPHGNKIYIRYSIGAFNTQADLDKLYNALQEILQEGKYLFAFK